MPMLPVLHAPGDILAMLGVVGPDAAAEPELRVVGDRDRVIDTVVGNHREHRPKDLLPGDRVAVLYIGEDRGLYEPAAVLVLWTTATGDDPRALGAALLDVALHALALTGARQRTDLCRGVQRITDLQAGAPQESDGVGARGEDDVVALLMCGAGQRQHRPDVTLRGHRGKQDTHRERSLPRREPIGAGWCALPQTHAQALGDHCEREALRHGTV